MVDADEVDDVFDVIDDVADFRLDLGALLIELGHSFPELRAAIGNIVFGRELAHDRPQFSRLFLGGL